MTKEEFEELKKNSFSECCRLKGYYDNPMKVTFEEGMKFMKIVFIENLKESISEDFTEEQYVLESFEEKLKELKL